MNSELKVHVEFLDGRPAQDETMNCDIPPGQEQKACIQLLASINATNGLMRFTANGISFLPLTTIKSIDITTAAVLTANIGDMNAATARVRTLDAVASRIKL